MPLSSCAAAGFDWQGWAPSLLLVVGWGFILYRDALERKREAQLRVAQYRTERIDAQVSEIVRSAYGFQFALREYQLRVEYDAELIDPPRPEALPSQDDAARTLFDRRLDLVGHVNAAYATDAKFAELAQTLFREYERVYKHAINTELTEVKLGPDEADSTPGRAANQPPQKDKLVPDEIYTDLVNAVKDLCDKVRSLNDSAIDAARKGRLFGRVRRRLG